MDRKKYVYASTLGKGEGGLGFKLFLSDLALLIPPECVHHLASCFEFSKANCDKLETSDHPVHSMIACLQERDIITSSSISQLIKALELLELIAIGNKIMTSFQKWTSMFPEEERPKKSGETSGPRKVLEAVKKIQDPKTEEEVTPETRKVLDAVKGINNSEREQGQTPKPRKVLEAAKRISDAEQNAKSKTEIGKVMEAVKRINATTKIERLTTEDGKVTSEVNRIIQSEKAERRAKIQRKIMEAINPGRESKRLEQDYMRELETSAVNKTHFEKFLNHVNLNLVRKLTIKDGRCIKLFSSTKEKAEDYVLRFFMQLATGDFLATEKLSSTYTYHQGYAKTVCGISKKDALFAILTCCDTFLLRDVLDKLHCCGSAVPIILPSPTSSKLTFCLWSLRKCMHNISATETLPSRTLQFCTHPFITVSALRFGKAKFSKSHILNTLLADLQQNQELRCYLSKEEDPEKSMWSKGIVEITWNIHENDKDTHYTLPSFSLLNLRGDGLCHNRQVKFCSNVSYIIIVFLSLRLIGKYIQEVNQMAVSSRVIVLLDCSERDAINLSSSDKVTFLFCEGLTSQDMCERIKTCLHDIMQSKEGRKWCGITLEDLSKSCSLFDIDVDEDNHKEAKTLANKIGNTISLSIDQSKSRIFTHQKSLIFNNSGIDEVDFNGKLQDHSLSPISYTFNTFLKGLSLDGHERQIFMSLLKMILDQKSSNAMYPYFKQYKSLLEEVRNILNEMATSNQAEEQLSQHGFHMNDLTLLEDKIEQNVISVELFLLELWWLIQCSDPNLTTDFTTELYLDCLSTWLLNGNSIDIFKSAACHSPADWCQIILKGLQSALGTEAKILVVAAFGDISCSKSKFLKHLLGANFTQSDTFFASGIRIQLIPIQNTTETSLDINYLLLVDIENVKLSEIIREGLTGRRERICTLVSSITDVLIVSIDEDSIEEEKTAVFDIVVNGMLTNSKCKASMQCCVVYHVENASVIEVNSLEEYTLKKLKDSSSKIEKVERTDDSENTLVESDLYERVCEKMTSSQNQDNKLHVKMLTSLKADISHEVNQSYVKSIQDMQKYTFQMLKDYQHNFSTLSEISEGISSCYCVGTL